MYTYHYYARFRLESGNITDADGLITTSRPISYRSDYTRLKEFLAAETGKTVVKTTIISLNNLGQQEA